MMAELKRILLAEDNPKDVELTLTALDENNLANEVVVVNDASADETAGLLEQYRLRYPDRVNVIHRPVSRGPAPAKNQAMARCIAEYSCIETYTSFRPTAERAAGLSAESPSRFTREPCSMMSNIVRRT